MLRTNEPRRPDSLCELQYDVTHERIKPFIGWEKGVAADHIIYREYCSNSGNTMGCYAYYSAHGVKDNKKE